MKSIITRRLIYTFSTILLATFLAACGSDSTTSTTTVTTAPSGSSSTPTQATVPTQASTSNQAAVPAQASTSNQAAVPAQASTSKQAAAPTQASISKQAAAPTQAHTSTSTSNTGTAFKPLTGANFTINYPAIWQTSHQSLPGGESGNGQNPVSENIYGFVAQDNISGLHIVRNGDEQAVGGMVDQLLGGQFSCGRGDKSVPSQVTVGGVTWSQVDLVCTVSSTNYEIRELLNESTKYGQTVIMYGAFQQVGKGAVAPDFAHAETMYFEPMLASFKFN